MPSVTSGSSMSKTPVARLPDGDRHDVAELVLALDPLVGREDEHDLVVGPVDERRRQGDRRRGVPAAGLDDEPNVRDLVADELAVAPLRHAIDVALADERGDPAHSPLEERLVTEKREEGLRSLGSAERPEPGPATTGQDHGVHGRSFIVGRSGAAETSGDARASALRSSAGSGRRGRGPADRSC